jgi:hypothetical protein
MKLQNTASVEKSRPHCVQLRTQNFVSMVGSMYCVWQIRQYVKNDKAVPRLASGKKHLNNFNARHPAGVSTAITHFV